MHYYGPDAHTRVERKGWRRPGHVRGCMVARRTAMAAAVAVGSLPELGWQVRVVGEAAGDTAQLQPRWIEPWYCDGGV
jgi:hypothetical protein